VKNFFDVKTDHRLIAKLEHAAQHRQSSSEILEQSVSFVYGSMDKSSGVTREQVRRIIIEQEGIAEPAR
jgi:hypothetical protein